MVFITIICNGKIQTKCHGKILTKTISITITTIIINNNSHLKQINIIHMEIK